MIATATKAWEAQSWSTCSESLKEALALASQKRVEAIRAAFPNPGEGWTLEEQNKNDNAAAAMFMPGMAGMIVNGKYRGPNSQRMSIDATLSSPMIQMLAMQFNNPAMRDDKTELIEYENHKALLTKNSDTRCKLMILMGDSLVQAESNGFGDERLLEIMNQETVTKIAEAITK